MMEIPQGSVGKRLAYVDIFLYLAVFLFAAFAVYLLFWQDYGLSERTPPRFNTVVASVGGNGPIYSVAVGACGSGDPNDRIFLENDGPIFIPRGQNGTANIIHAQVHNKSPFPLTFDASAAPAGTSFNLSQCTQASEMTSPGLVTNPVTGLQERIWMCDDKAKLTANTTLATPIGSFVVPVTANEGAAFGINPATTDVEFVVLDDIPTPPLIFLDATPNMIFVNDPAAPKTSILSYSIVGNYVPSTCEAKSVFGFDERDWNDDAWLNNNFAIPDGFITTPPIVDITFYRLRCKNSIGEWGMAQAIIGTNVDPDLILAPEVVLTAAAPGVPASTDAITVVDGTTATLDWTVTGDVNTCILYNDFSIDLVDYSDPVTGASASGAIDSRDEGPLALIGEPYGYSMFCAGPGGAGDAAEVTVNVIVNSLCGNNIIETGETCDDGNTVTESCVYGQTSCTVCGSSCQLVPGATSYCGDGTVNLGNGELCDSGVSGFSCTNFDYTGGGPLLCDPTSCVFDFSNCTSDGGGSQCSDSIDNDGDGFCDTAGATCTDGSIPGDPSCDDPTDDTETDCGDSQCDDPTDDTETDCGDSQCDVIYGENPISCPLDCAVQEEEEI